MKNLLKSAFVAAAAFAFGTTAPAHSAVLLACSDGPGIDLVSSGCSAMKGDGIYINQGGGDGELSVEAAILAATGTAVDIGLYGEAGGDGGIFGVTGFGGSSGTWDLTDDSILIKYITIKAGTAYALFELETPGSNFGVWSTAGLFTGGGQQPNVSHLRFWTADGFTTTGGVPEPGTWMLMLMGFFAIGAMLRRREGDVVLKAA